MNPASLAGDLADAYGLVLSEEERRLTLRSLFKKRFEGVPVEGDRVAIGDFVLTLKRNRRRGRHEMAGFEVPGRQGLGFLNLGVKFGNRPSEGFRRPFMFDVFQIKWFRFDARGCPPFITR